ncbi:MAG TPA: EspA/EspE family type VII secretion system effector [Mycobacterium sp.]|nr:EspA/EspE family type VII secretion system effector [Mycobacterium sp.]
MSALDAFLATWSQARTIFGQGTPSEGARFDQSGRLRGLRDDVKSAAPGTNWTGSGSDTYAEANSRHARALGNMADLDERLGVEVDRSAAVVAAGRRDLDAVRQWVVDAAATVPRTAAGDRMLWSVVSKGSGELTDIINRSNSDLAAIAQRIRGLGSEYQAMGQPKESPGADVMSVKGDGDDKGDAPETALDLNDVVYKKPGEKGDYGYMELIPDSGVWVPDPNYGNPR